MPNWSAYGTQYDLMADNNPAYQELLHHCLQSVLGWGLQPGDTLADFAAGTGNFSIAIARAIPHVNVLHIELDPVMMEHAFVKAAGLQNWQPIHLDLSSDDWGIPKLSGAVMIHALYAIPNPKAVIRGIEKSLVSNGRFYVADFGRLMDVWDWARYLVPNAVQSLGVWNTLSLLSRTGAVRRENKSIARSQRAGVYWLHDLGEFTEAITSCGLEVEFKSDRFYRGYDDVVVARKNTET